MTTRNYKRASTGIYHELRTPSIVAPSQYPSEWFDKPEHLQPIATYHKGTLTKKNIRKVVLKGMDTTLSVHVAKAFLHYYFASVSNKLTETWSSYYREIGRAGQDVTPWDIIEVSPLDERIRGDEKGLDERDCGKEAEHWMVIYVLGAARLDGITITDYLDTLKAKFLTQMRNKGYTGSTYPTQSVFESWPQDESYMKMVAAIDMFFSKFPDHEHNALRVCTLRSRFRDCTALLSIGYFSSLVSLEHESDTLDWLLTEKQADEAVQMMDPNQELTKEDSYFPYQSDMKLVKKTYYSAAKNPHIYFVLHAAGTLLNSSRSKNAKYLSDHNIVNNVVNAKIIAYAFSKSIKLTKAFVEDEDDVLFEQEEETEAVSEDALEPKEAIGSVWYSYMESLNFQLTPKMIAFVEKSKEALTDVRPGTIGEYVKKFF